MLCTNTFDHIYVYVSIKQTVEDDKCNPLIWLSPVSSCLGVNENVILLHQTLSLLQDPYMAQKHKLVPPQVLPLPVVK